MQPALSEVEGSGVAREARHDTVGSLDAVGQIDAADKSRFALAGRTNSSALHKAGYIPGVLAVVCPPWSVRRTPRWLFSFVVVVQSMSSALMTPDPPPTKV